MIYPLAVVAVTDPLQLSALERVDLALASRMLPAEGSTEWIPYSGRQVPVKTGDLLYTAPPRREWQSLSEGEVASCWAKGFEACKDQTVGDLRMHIARDIEAALKEKNQ